jgi:NAD(P)H-hydrate epimerase
MKIFRCDQIKEIDEYTIRHEPVASIDLMERAAGQLLKWITTRYGVSEHFVVFAGPGNNGGDGLALARMLISNGYSVDIYYLRLSDKISADCELNMNRLKNVTNVTINTITGTGEFPFLSSNDIIIDAIFGSGLKHHTEGLAAEIIQLINKTEARKISIDLPSGLFGEDNSINNYSGVIKADFTLTFQFPKLSFMFSENAPYLGEWYILPIGLDKNAIRSFETAYTFLQNSDIYPLLKKRKKFDHKGNFGHGLLVSGSYGKMGAAILAAGASLRTGIGLITCHIPAHGNPIVQSALPESMVQIDNSEHFVSEIGNTDSFSAVGIGPGLGIFPESQKALIALLRECKRPIVIDADALNMLSIIKDSFLLLPAGTILTPHPKEFERLAGKTHNGYERLQRQIEFSREHNCIVVLKGAHSSVTFPDGNVFFNSTGNPGMATGGSGDVLTGIILSLLSQGYTPEHAALSGVFIHGVAGDLAAEESCYESIIASDIINSIGKAFNKIRDF